MISKRAVKTIRDLDVVKARNVWRSMRDHPDEVVLATLHRYRCRWRSRFTQAERIASRVWLMMHGHIDTIKLIEEK